MKKMILAILILASPACADFNFNGGWTTGGANNASEEFITDLNGNGMVDAGEIKCAVPFGQPTVCAGTVPDSFAGKQFWVRSKNSVGQFIDSTPITFTVLTPAPASGVFFNATWFQP